MHRTLKQTVQQRVRATEAAQQKALNQFRRVYDEERPHHALRLNTPASVYTESVRPYPDDIPDPEYPAHFELRKVSKIGVFAWRSRQIFVSEALHNETIGFEGVADGLWSVFFGDIMQGRFSEHEFRFTPGMGR